MVSPFIIQEATELTVCENTIVILVRDLYL